MQMASRMEVLPWALEPMRMMPSGGASRERESKQRKLRRRRWLSTGGVREGFVWVLGG